MLKKISINVGLIFMICLFFVLTSIFYITYNYLNTRRVIVDGLDKLLKEGAYATVLIIGETYHDRVTDKNSISTKEYMENLYKLSTLANQNNLVYVYTMVKDKENIYFTSSNATPEELKDESYDRYYDIYDEPSDGLKKAFETGEIVFDEYTDNYGTFRSIFVPMKTEKGKVYVTAADLSMEYLKEQLSAILFNSILMGLAILIFGILLSIALSIAITKPLSLLTVQADKVSLGENIDTEIKSDSFKEITVLANSLNRLRISLDVAIKQLKEK